MLRQPSPPGLLDVRWHLAGPPGIEDFRRGHIPGAVFCDLDTDLAAPPGRGGRHPLPEIETFASAMRRLGVRAEAPVVVYDDGPALSAARAWWLLRYFGHDDVRVLDGGLAAWTAAGLPLESGDAAAAAPGDFRPRPGGLPLLDATAAAELARHGVLLDARAAERYRGETEPVDPVAGHIPGARSLPATETLAPDGRLLDPVSLAARFAEAGVGEGFEVGAYCGSGVTAAHTVLALDAAGVRGALYAGSWSEWITDPERPVALGADPG